MIRSIDIKNFKSIKSKHFSLRNLNVLLGLNGQGKSSFIQLLLLLRQSFSSLKKNGVLLLNGEEFKLGTTRDALYQYSQERESLSIDLVFDDNAPYSMIFDYTIGSDVFNRINEEGNNSLLDENQALFNNSFQLLYANRIEPKTTHEKSYSSVVSSGNIGSLGQYTVDYLETRGNEEVAFDNYLHPKTERSRSHLGHIIINKQLIYQVTLWMREISPNVSIVTSTVSSDLVKLEYEYEQPTYGKTMRFKPENVGFGISYALHVVVALLKAKAGDLIVIENPESHVHPRGQAELGKLISLVAQNDVQIIIETHSDHIVNGIRVGIKEERIDKEKVILFYFDKVVSESEQFSEITDIKIDKNGTLSKEPDGLLDEWGNQLLKLL